MKNKIYPCIWFNQNANEAAEFYIEVFGEGKITHRNEMLVTFELSGQKFLGINGGNEFQPNSSVSYMVILEDKDELEKIWNQLTVGGMELMPLDKYDWSEKYGWVQDKFGVSWQLYFGSLKDVHGQKFIPTYMFTQDQNGKAEEAVQFYLDLFKNSKSDGLMRYEEGDMKGLVMHTQFVIDGYVLMAMDGGAMHNFSFSEGNSMFIECENQAEIDHFWNAFADGGNESQCGWIQDKYGIWWQVIPSKLMEWMTNPAIAPKVSQAFYKMKKLDIKVLEEVANS